MAENLDDGEFWLPPQFLTDDDALFDDNTVLNPKNDGVSRTLFPYISSPVESSETESDEEEHMAELARRIAQSTLELNGFATEKYKVKFVSGSPQSTLCAFGSSGKGSSPNGSVSRGNSQRATWDLLRAAAGEVERMRLSDRNYGFVPKPSQGSYNQQLHQPQSLSHQQLQLQKFEMLKQQQMAKQQQRNQMVPNRGRNNVSGDMGLSPCAWPGMQQHGFGMRAVFLGNPSGKRERNGTGVFLPRCVDGPAESRKKPACSTVLVPERVAHALNLKLGGMVGGHFQNQHPCFNGASNMENASAGTRIRRNYGFSQQRRNLRPQPPMNHEIRLPQEWTY